MLKLKIKILTILFFLYMVALGMNASGLPSDEVIPSGVEVILVPHDNNEEEKTEKDKWHRTPIRLPRLLSIDGLRYMGILIRNVFRLRSTFKMQMAKLLFNTDFPEAGTNACYCLIH